jgi:hypothetical protein
MNRYAISCLPLLVLASLTGCAVDGEEDDVASDEEAITAACDLGSSCPSSIQLLQARSYQNRPPANLRGDLEIVSDQGWDKTPRRFSQKTSRPMKYATGRVLLAGNAAGNAEIGVDDFFLFEALDLQGQRLAAATINAGAGIVKLDGQPVRALERDPVSAGWKSFAGGSIDIASILPKDQPFRLRVSAMDFAGAASATDIFLTVKPGAPAVAVGGRACTTDAECGGGAAMCFIDQCKRVEDSTKSIWGFEGLATAYGTDNVLRIAYQQYASGVGWANATHTTRLGKWIGNTVFDGADSWGDAWSLDRAPGRDPWMAAVSEGGTSDSFRIGEDGGPSLPSSPYRVKSFAVARNNAGTTFLAYALHNARNQSECTVQFSKRPAGGTWSAPEKVGTCGWGGPSLVVHVRKDGNADILTSSNGVSLLMYRRQNPIDPWSLTSVLPASGYDRVIKAHGVDGTTHFVVQRWDSLPSYGNFYAKYLELGDEGVVRDIDLPMVRDESADPYTSMDVDPLGNAWIVQRSLRHQKPPVLIRIDPAGTVAQRAVGTVVPGPWHSASVAVSSRGEIAFTHGSTSSQATVGLRRLIPVN